MAVARERTQHDMGEEGAQHSAVINFKTSASITHTHTHGYDHSNVLSFEHQKPHDEYWMWDDNLITDHQPSSSNDFTSCSKEDGSLGWLYSDPTTLPPHHFIHDPTPEPSFLHKRPHLGENSNVQTAKKQCMAKSKQKPKERSTSSSSVLASKDPQSIAAKNRRERISERLKVLQELVPNGAKVDLVTMLEKAIGYVKFLQLQVKVLGTDEFWPVQGGKAPDISQVKEAIDAILSSQRDSRNSSSSSKS